MYSKRSDNAADEKRSILVKSLPYDAKVEEVREIFARYGEINDVYLPRDFHTRYFIKLIFFIIRRQRGFGFVEFAKREDAEEALEQLNGYKMGDREIQLQIAQNRRKKPEDFRNNRRPRRYSRSRSHSRHGHSHSHHHHSHRRSRSDSRRRRY